MSKAASHTSDSRMKALAAASTGMSAYSAYKAVEAGQGTTIDGKDNQIATGKTGADGKPETRDASNADKAGGVNISISVGSSSNKSHSESSSDTSAGSRITAAGSINLVATGAGQDSNILIQGSDLKAAKDIALAADNRIQLQASQDADQQHGKNSGSSGSIGISFGTSGLMLNASVSKSRGHADGDSVSYNNTHLNAGENVSLSSGGDLALKGAVVAGKQISADAGGNLSIESLQDKNHYDSKQQSVGGSLSVGYGMMGGSISASNSKVNSDFVSVGEQSGILAGDGGFKVKVKGDTTLTGGVISSTEQAVQDHNNQFATGGQLAMTDLHNQADYNASSSSLNIGTSMNLQGMWSPSGSGIGFGNDSGSAGSDTRSGISGISGIAGIAGNSAARTGDPQSGIQRIFDADKVQQDIDAQTLITQTFGQQASSAVGKYAETQIKQANALIEQAKQAHADGQEQQAQQLFAQAEQINQDWGEQGKLRIGLHTVIGGLTGGAAGAAGSLTGSLSAVEASRLLKENGITQENNPALYNTLVTLASSAAGGVVGGSAGAGAAFNEVTNNDLAHQVAAIVEGKKRCKTQQCQADYDKALQIAINVNGDFSSRENANTVVIGSKDHDAYYPPNQLLPQPDYSSSTGYIPLIGNVSKVVNNYTGAIYYSYGQSRPIAGTDWSSMPKPGFSFVNGYVFGAKNGMDVDNFIQGGAWSFSAFVPIPFLKSVGVGGNIVHAIGGATGVELGVGTPGYTYNPSVTICATCKR
ncbi:hemagglutinin repeat-containing protein [Aquitalea magnusonii]|nr:hemagglutinin repeat-containing protein [Aquitalea magnusonii]